MRVLVVEDDFDLSGALMRLLTRRGFQATHCTDGMSALQVLQQSSFELVVLDLGLPGMDGLQLLQRLRDRGFTMPVLVLTARGAVGDRIAGLNIGADDYMAKPFDPDELEARLRALARRAGFQDEPRCGDLRMDRTAGAFYADEQALELTPREGALLTGLMEQPGRAITKSRLAVLVFGSEAQEQADAVEVFVHRLRKKLARTRVEIATLRGLGYLVRERRETD